MREMPSFENSRPIHRLLRNGVVMAVGGLLAQAIFLAIEALLAREIGARDYGVFGAVYALTLLVVHLVDMGMNSKLIETGAREPASIPGTLGRMLPGKLALFLLVYPLVLAGLVLADFPNASALFAWFGFFGLLMTVQDSLAAVHSAQQRMEYNALFQTAVAVFVLLAALLLVRPGASLPDVGKAYVAGSAIVTALWLWTVWYELRPKLAPPRLISTLRNTSHYGLSALLSYGSFRMGTLVLALLRDALEVGMFVAAYKFVELGYKVPQLASRVVAPQLFADSAHRPANFRFAAELLLRAAAAGSAAAVVIIMFAADFLIWRVFGRQFDAAGQLLALLGVSLGIKTFSLAVQTVLTAADLHEVRTRALSVSTAIGLVVTIGLTSTVGAVGTALGVLAGDVVLLLMLLAGLRYAQLPSPASYFVAVPVSATGIAITVPAALDFDAVISLPLGLVLLTLILWITGYIQPVLERVSVLRSGSASQ